MLAGKDEKENVGVKKNKIKRSKKKRKKTKTNERETKKGTKEMKKGGNRIELHSIQFPDVKIKGLRQENAFDD